VARVIGVLSIKSLDQQAPPQIPNRICCFLEEFYRHGVRKELNDVKA
jgi:hypothetical protein